MTLHVHVDVPVRPRSLNSERTGNRFKRVKFIKAERVAAMHATMRGMSRFCDANDLDWTDGPYFDSVAVDVFPYARDRRFRQDIANCLPTAKACIDGAIDAGLVRDDDDTHITAITFHPHRFGRDALVLVFSELVRGGEAMGALIA